MYFNSNCLRRALSGAFLAGILLAGSAPARAEAASVDPEIHQQFSSKVRERNTVVRKLQRLDREAASLMMKDESALEVNAKQQSLQDKLNVIELRLAIMSSRYDFEVPPSPVADPPQVKTRKASPTTARNDVAQGLAPDGHARAKAVIQQELNAMLADLEFVGFPENQKDGR